MTRLDQKLLWNILCHFCILLVSGQLLVKVQSKGRRGDCVTGDLFYSRGSRESKAWYLLEANHALLQTKDTEEWFSSLFSHVHNDPSLPSVLECEKNVTRCDRKGKGLSLHPLLIPLFREHVVSPVFLSCSLLRFLFWFLISNSSLWISFQLSTVSKTIFVQDYWCNLSNVCLYY